MGRKVSIVIDTNFGDSGKGSLVNYLCQHSLSQGRNPIVIRFGAGPQCGHTVVAEDGKRHVFSHFGSGTLLDVPTLWTNYCLFEPGAFMKEKKILNELGIDPNITISYGSQVITPYDRQWNRRHDTENGSCGVGVGATMRRIENSPLRLTVNDLHAPQWILEHKLNQIKDYYRPWKFVDEVDAELELFFNYVKSFKEYTKDWVNDYSPNLRDGYDDYIFEGHQGLLLDRENGMFPHVTYSHTNSKNAMEIVNDAELEANITTFYVSRCYLTRHGNGPMGKEEVLPLINNENETNVSNKYQGNFRTGRFDFGLYNYAIDSNVYANENQVKVITCMDQFKDTIPIRGVDGIERDITHKAFEALFPDNTLFSYGPKFELK